MGETKVISRESNVRYETNLQKEYRRQFEILLGGDKLSAMFASLPYIILGVDLEVGRQRFIKARNYSEYKVFHDQYLAEKGHEIGEKYSALLQHDPIKAKIVWDCISINSPLGKVANLDYRTLGISPNATDDEIVRAYNKLYNPDATDIALSARSVMAFGAYRNIVIHRKHSKEGWHPNEPAPEVLEFGEISNKLRRS